MKTAMTRRLAMLGALGACMPLGANTAFGSNQWLEPGPTVPNALLQDHEGRTHQLAQLLTGRPVVISFFFTGCTTFCPPQTAVFRDLQQQLPKRVSRALLLSISLDPLADNPQALRSYATRFNVKLGLQHQWLMLTGAPAELSRVWAAFDSQSGRPEDHLSTVWVGAQDKRRWLRSTGLVSSSALSGLLEASVS